MYDKNKIIGKNESWLVIHKENLTDHGHIGELYCLVTTGESLVESIIRDQG